MHILVASSSVFRQRMYREAVESVGHPVAVAADGVECVAQIRQQWPELLILEAPLFWGGVEGVLQCVENERQLRGLPVILVAVGTGSIDWFRLSRYRIDNLLFRIPTAHELGQAVARISALPARAADDSQKNPREAAYA